MISTLELKDGFNNIKTSREAIIVLLDSLNTKIIMLKNMYQTLLKNNISHSFGLDSLQFQNKMIESEYEFILKQFKIIDNRIYGDYYKLYKIVIKYINDNIYDKKILQLSENSKNYPVYKDLNNEIEYDFINTEEIHKDIIQVIEALQNELLMREQDLKIDDQKRKSGLNIDNLINSYHYNNVILKEQITLFIDYVKVFHKFHIKYIHRFKLKTKLFYGQINADIKLEKKGEINIDNLEITNDINNLNFSSEEQEKIKLLTRSDTKNLNKYELTTTNIINKELNNIFTNSSDTDTLSNNSNDDIVKQVTPSRLLILYK